MRGILISIFVATTEPRGQETMEVVEDKVGVEFEQQLLLLEGHRKRLFFLLFLPIVLIRYSWLSLVS